jgi:hypothetical protein
VERFVTLNAASALASREGEALLAGEIDGYDRPSFGPLPASDRLVMLTDERAVARLPAQGERQPDIYLYLRARGGAWTIEALRTLATTGIARELRRLYRAMPSRTAEQEWQLANAELTLASDRELREWFGRNREALDQVRSTADAHLLLERLHLIAIDRASGGLVRLTIGGLVDNEVGFLHVADPALVPPIDPSGHFWIEPLGDGWYLFKTT